MSWLWGSRAAARDEPPSTATLERAIQHVRLALRSARSDKGVCAATASQIFEQVATQLSMASSHDALDRLGALSLASDLFRVAAEEAFAFAERGERNDASGSDPAHAETRASSASATPAEADAEVAKLLATPEPAVLKLSAPIDMPLHRRRSDPVWPVSCFMPDVIYDSGDMLRGSTPATSQFGSGGGGGIYILVPNPDEVGQALLQASRRHANTRAFAILGSLQERAIAHVLEHGETTPFHVMQLEPNEWSERAGAASNSLGSIVLYGAARVVVQMCERLRWSVRNVKTTNERGDVVMYVSALVFVPNNSTKTAPHATMNASVHVAQRGSAAANLTHLLANQPHAPHTDLGEATAAAGATAS